MSWVMPLEYEGLKFGILSDSMADFYSNSNLGMKVFFHLGDATTQEAIANDDPRIKKILQFALEHYDELHTVGWAGDPYSWYEWEKEDPYELERKCKIIIASEFSSTEIRQRAESVLPETYRLQQKLEERKAKRHHSARRRVAFSGEHDRLMLALIERDGYHCQECGTIENITIDHIIPLSRGGSDELDNLRLLCRSCNSRKGDRL